jgi:YaiO family outer membrane protein
MKRSAIKLTATVLLMLANVAWAESSFDNGMRLKQQEKFAEAAAAFRQTVTSEPQNAQAWQQLATVEAWLNHFDVSVAAWRSVLKITPNQASAHVGLARVLYWQAKHPEALREVDAGIALETPKADVLVLKGDILLASGDRSKARAIYLQAQGLAQGDADIAKKITRTDEPKTWRLDAGYLADRFSAIRGDESSSYLQLGNQVSADTTLYLRADNYNSFNSNDKGVSAGGYFRVTPLYLLNAELGFNVDTADFRPKQMLVLNSEFLIEGAVQPLLGVRYMQYDETIHPGDVTPVPGGAVTTITPGVRISMPSSSLELRYGLSQNLDKSKTGVFQAKLTFERDSFTPYLVFASGEEALPPQSKAKIKVFGAGIVWNIDSEWGARIDLVHEDRTGFYKHNTIGLGFSRHF